MLRRAMDRASPPQSDDRASLAIGSLGRLRSTAQSRMAAPPREALKAVRCRCRT